MTENFFFYEAAFAVARGRRREPKAVSASEAAETDWEGSPLATA